MFRDPIGYRIKTLSNMMKRNMECQFGPRNDRATLMQGWIIGYLYRNRDKEVFQRDIQEQFSIRRSTVTGILQLMEKNGLSNYKIFMRTFKKLYGSTPQKMRSNRIRHI